MPPDNSSSLITFFSDFSMRDASFGKIVRFGSIKMFDYLQRRVAVGNMSGCRYISDCRSSGRELDPSPLPYFRGDCL